VIPHVSHRIGGKTEIQIDDNGRHHTDAVRRPPATFSQFRLLVGLMTSRAADFLSHPTETMAPSVKGLDRRKAVH
jgi:hypothetical protein